MRSHKSFFRGSYNFLNLFALNPYINFYWRFFHKKYGKVEIKNLKTNVSANPIEIYGSGCEILNNEIQADGKDIRIRHSNINVISCYKIDAKIEAGITFETSSNNTVKKI